MALFQRKSVSRLKARQKNRRDLKRLVLEKLESRRVMANTPIITEFLASNSDGLRDSDGESSDWIEIYNPTDTPFNLSGWSLTDDPNDLNQWSFPSQVIQPYDFLTVFASGKNRATAGQQLHTNFRLSGDGDYLALVNGSTIVSQYAPTYPTQATNISYGSRFENQTLLALGSNARTLIPNNGTLGSSWQQPGFNDSTWAATPVGIGFGIVEPGYDVTYYKTNTDVLSLTTAFNVINNPALQTNVVRTRAETINYLGSGSFGNFSGDRAFPTQEIGDDINNFVIRATTTITIPTTGTWTFGVNSDDGFRATLSRNGVNYAFEFSGPRAPATSLATYSLTAGEYAVTLVTFEGNGGSSAEFFAAPGSHSSFNSTFDLIGDVANGGLAALIPVPAGPTSPLRSDISASMRNVNASAYVRVPFTVADLASIESLKLKMRYDDGFVAYLNGTEVARRNAPNTLSFNSTASSDRSVFDSATTEEINISSFRNALVAGNNVLAIHGLNSSASDSDFLVIPELYSSKLFDLEQRYFAMPTPGQSNTQSALGLVSRPTFSVPAGFYETTQTVSIQVQNATPDTFIRYTVDGSEPTADKGILYSAPIIVSGTTTLRTVAYRTNYISLPSTASSYLFVNDIIYQSSNGAPPAGWPSTWNQNVVDYGMDPDIVTPAAAESVKNALKAIPSLNISTDLANLFDPVIGIYSNPANQGRDWERMASVELINPSGAPGFQVNAGLRIRGGFSRSTDNPKHSFRLFFRGEYGDSTLEYPIAGTDAASSFKKIDLRTAQNYSWSFYGDPSNNFVTDVYNRITQQANGQPSTSGEWYHLYLNGVYWGLYETQERAEAEFATTYFGGESINYDVIKAEAGPYTVFATDGNLDAWQRMWNALNQNLPNSLPTISENAEYLKLQGKNPDGTDNPNYEVLLDVDNLIVYMMGILYGGNLDAPISNFLNNDRVNNFYAIRDRTGREGFKFFLHDSEHTLRDVNENRNGPYPAGNDFNYSNPQWFHQRLMSNAEYRMRFADLVQQAFFNDGPLSIAANQARFQSEATKINQAIIAESARWGDAKQPTSPLRREDWLNAVNSVIANYFPARNSIVINQFRNTTWNGTTLARLFPTIDAPRFLVNNQERVGGIVGLNSLLRFGSSSGTVYYTFDGSDPRMVGGEISPIAQSYSVNSSTEQLFGTGSTWRYRDNGVDQQTAWRSTNFNDSTWSVGNGEFGYGDGGETTVVGFGPNSNNKYITTYFRKNFNITNLADITALNLLLRRDDGAVIYINGVEAARSNMPTGIITASTLASSAVAGTDETTLFPISLNPNLLVAGNNVIAIEIHQSAANTSDLSFDASLSVFRQASPAIPMGIQPRTYTARTLSPTGEWSAIEQATFSTPLIPASSTNLIVTEVHYNPRAFTGTNATLAPFNDAQNFEFIELRNTSSTDVVLLDGVSFSGITYTFPTSNSGPVTWLGPGESIVVVKNQIAFEARYLQPGSPFLGIKIAPGDYGTTNLSNGGEQIDVFAAGSTPTAPVLIQSFTFDDVSPWPFGPATNPSSPDGGGPSLTPIFLNPALYDSGTNWRASFVLDGTPGIEENDPPVSIVLSNNSIDENVSNAILGTLSTIDPDLFESFTYSLIPGGLSEFFSLNGNTLQFGATPLDFETTASGFLDIRSVDSKGAQRIQRLTINVNNVAPKVTGLFVRGTGWNEGYLNMLATNGLGSSTAGFQLIDGTQQIANSSLITWQTVNQISATFGESVSVDSNALRLFTSANTEVPLASNGFSYNATTRTATWTLAGPLQRDKYLISLDSNLIDDGGLTLDGEWTTSVSTYASSGNGTAGGDLNFRFNYLPGDVSRSGQTNSGDANLLISLGTVAPSASNYWRDITANNQINSGDTNFVRSLGTLSLSGIPEPTNPPAPRPGAPLLAARTAPLENNANVLSVSDLKQIANVAIDIWASAGISDSQIAALRSVPILVADFGATSVLGMSFPTRIVIDNDASGWGWFVDQTPRSNEEFRMRAGSLTAVRGGTASGRMDLLTVVLHEMGHQLGLDDDYSDIGRHTLMAGRLETGIRRTVASDLTSITSPSLQAAHVHSIFADLASVEEITKRRRK